VGRVHLLFRDAYVAFDQASDRPDEETG
jgi:hypothetical protein